MRKLRFRCRPLVRGVAKGEALVSSQPFGFWGEVDPYTGYVIDVHHEWYGKNIAGKVLVFPKGRGSTGSGGILVQAFTCGKAPIAIVNIETDFIILSGPLFIAEFYGKYIPVVDKPEKDPIKVISTGDIVLVDGDRGIVEVIKKG